MGNLSEGILAYNNTFFVDSSTWFKGDVLITKSIPIYNWLICGRLWMVALIFIVFGYLMYRIGRETEGGRT